MTLAESDVVELKESWTEDAMADLAAFANTRGGTLYVGIRDSGEVQGCDVSDDVQQRICSKIRNILQIGADIRVKAILTVGLGGELTSVLYRKLTSASDTTASRDIHDLEQLGVVERTGTGRNTRYVVRMRLRSPTPP